MKLIPDLALVNATQSPLIGQNTALHVNFLVDDSTSIRRAQQAICNGHSLCLEQLEQVPIPVFVSTKPLKGPRLSEYTHLKNAVLLNRGNYRLGRGTPFYDQAHQFLVENERMSEMSRRLANSFPLFMTVFITDGADSSSINQGPADVKAVVDRMLASGNHIVAGIGIDNGVTNFLEVFASIGIPKEWRLVLERTDDSIIGGMTKIGTVSQRISGPHSFAEVAETGVTKLADDLDVARMMGAVDARPPEELGQASTDKFTWRPRSRAYELNASSDQWKKINQPMAFNPKIGFYELPLPPEGTIYVIGRHNTSNEPDDADLQSFITSAKKQNPAVRIVFIALKDRLMKAGLQKTSLSRFHAVLERIGDASTVRPVRGDITVTSDDPSQDRYLQAGRERDFIDPGQGLRLTPGIILRVISSIDH